MDTYRSIYYDGLSTLCISLRYSIIFVIKKMIDHTKWKKRKLIEREMIIWNS